MSNSVLRAFAGGTISSFGAVILFPFAACVGQFIVVLLEEMYFGSQVNDLASFFAFMFFSAMFGLLSGVGLILVAVEAWYFTKLLRDEYPACDYFFLVAICQVSLYVCATVMSGTIHDKWPVGLTALPILGVLWWLTKWARREILAADIKEMNEEGEKYRRELRERHEQANLRRLRGRR